ncbi:class I SAM-dependent methyltransferase [Tranquillimonas alkanivorans]|uniref:SAM-dependent methyltransferase, MidA family n=1 Tax=Tranquillimonas alkanivorans TaxID=441119 RepID=A0A1I5TBB3_9RHOB|nr:SAM-dependent methyltransferase [Tranquillimonas alkanivorans]SFP80335.1 SAM-dependent methyltransferase, MidA family [Tranquillimonas alkanivorans]
MTALSEILIRQIRTIGAMNVADYMAACLMHPEHGYYTTRDPLGRSGDFVTAPEISQMFGELLGLSLAQAWMDQGAPNPFALAELGPGRGTLMADVLRATRHVPGFHEAMEVHLVEASAPLRQVQAETLEGYAPTWHDGVGTLPERPLFLLANEFFDALPMRQFLRDGDGWRERMVTVTEDRLALGLSESAPLDALADRLVDTEDGDLVETSAPAVSLAAQIGERIARNGGAALIVDYGSWASKGDTLQAVAGHRKRDPLEAPGEADLTGHVAFGPMAAATPCAHTALVPQGVFLERLGITARAQALARRLTGAALENHIAAHRRLTHPDEMGHLFKVMGFHPDTAPPPPGLLHDA